MEKCEHEWGTDEQYQKEYCKKCFIEKLKELVFCSECEHVNVRMKELSDGNTYRITECRSPRNKKELITYYERNMVEKFHPRDKNKNNDCEWFERK